MIFENTPAIPPSQSQVKKPEIASIRHSKLQNLWVSLSSFSYIMEQNVLKLDTFSQFKVEEWT